MRQGEIHDTCLADVGKLMFPCEVVVASGRSLFQCGVSIESPRDAVYFALSTVLTRGCSRHTGLSRLDTKKLDFDMRLTYHLNLFVSAEKTKPDIKLN